MRFLPEDELQPDCWLGAPQASTPLVLPYSPESAARDGRPTRGQSSRESPQPRRARCSSVEQWKASRSRAARIADQLQSVAGQPQRILASGRVTQDLPAWLQILADVLGAPVIPGNDQTLHTAGYRSDCARGAGARRSSNGVRLPVRSDNPSPIELPRTELASSGYQALYEAAIAPAGADASAIAGMVGRRQLAAADGNFWRSDCGRGSNHD